jgi:hypothetical protein
VEPAQLYQRIRRRCDLGPSEFLTDDELGEIAEESYLDLWDFLIDLLGEEAPWELATVSTTGGQAYVDVPLATGCYRMLRLDASLGNDYYVPVERGQLGSDSWRVTPQTWQHASDVRYYARRGARAAAAARLGSVDSLTTWRIYFDPAPVAVYAVRLFYVPPPPIVISDDSPATYTSFPDEWPEYVVADVSAKVAVKQEADPAPHERERERVRDRIQRYSKPHQITQPRRILDQRRWQRGADFDPDDSDFMNRR